MNEYYAAANNMTDQELDVWLLEACGVYHEIVGDDATEEGYLEYVERIFREEFQKARH
jgi:hypothetical protein